MSADEGSVEEVSIGYVVDSVVISGCCEGVNVASSAIVDVGVVSTAGSHLVSVEEEYSASGVVVSSVPGNILLVDEISVDKLSVGYVVDSVGSSEDAEGGNVVSEVSSNVGVISVDDCSRSVDD